MLSVEALGNAGGLLERHPAHGQRELRPAAVLQVPPGGRPAEDRRATRPPPGRFVTTLYTLRTSYSFNTNMFLDALVQYDADRQLFNANVRFNFIHRPLSDLYVVYNEQQLRQPGEPVPAGRAVIVKFTRSVAFV